MVLHLGRRFPECGLAATTHLDMHAGRLCGVRFAWGLRRPRSVDVGVSVQRVSEMVLWVPGGGGGTTSAWLSMSAFYTMFQKSPGEGTGVHRHTQSHT